MKLLQTAIILCSFFGTLFAWLESARINARNPRRGLTLSDLPKYDAWYYHSGLLGFSLLFVGILLQLAILWL